MELDVAKVAAVATQAVSLAGLSPDEAANIVRLIVWQRISNASVIAEKAASIGQDADSWYCESMQRHGTSQLC